MWLVATILDSTKHFHHHREFYWTERRAVPLYRLKVPASLPVTSNTHNIRVTARRPPSLFQHWSQLRRLQSKSLTRMWKSSHRLAPAFPNLFSPPVCLGNTTHSTLAHLPWSSTLFPQAYAFQTKLGGNSFLLLALLAQYWRPRPSSRGRGAIHGTRDCHCWRVFQPPHWVSCLLNVAEWEWHFKRLSLLRLSNKMPRAV